MIYEDLSWIFLEWRRYQQRRLKPFGLTVQQYSLMRTIAKNNGLCANKAAELLHCDRPTLSVILTNLTAKGFVERVTDANDRRKCRLVLTESGYAETKRIEEAMGTITHKPFDCLTKQQRHELSAMLAAGRANLEKILESEDIPE